MMPRHLLVCHNEPLSSPAWRVRFRSEAAADGQRTGSAERGLEGGGAGPSAGVEMAKGDAGEPGSGDKRKQRDGAGSVRASKKPRGGGKKSVKEEEVDSDSEVEEVKEVKPDVQVRIAGDKGAESRRRESRPVIKVEVCSPAIPLGARRRGAVL